MFVPYNQISLQASVWIYQSDRKLNSLEKKDISYQLSSLCENWNAHGKPLNCSFQLHDWFICLFVDENEHQASGCSIDSSVSVIKSIANQYDIDFFNRMNIAYIDNNETNVLPLNDFKKIIKSNMKIYNNLVKTKADFEENRIGTVEDSWLKKYLKI